MVIDSENAAFLANISRAMMGTHLGVGNNHYGLLNGVNNGFGQLAAPRTVVNLTGLINECARQDHNLLDESMAHD